MAVRQLRPFTGRADGHTCQRFADERATGLRDDSRIRLAFQRDPWCWAPHLGFHRVSAPDTPVRLRASRGQWFAGAASIAPVQALRLGHGVGLSFGMAGTSEFARRFCEIAEFVKFTDAAPFAVLGHASRDYQRLQDRSARTAVHRAAFRRAYRLIDLPGELLGPAWTDLLERATAGLPVTPKETAWAAEQERAGRRLVDRAAGRTFRALYDGGHGGDSRGLVQLFSVIQPGEGRAAAWLRETASAIASTAASR
uniref:hypothetical protein n=1 Tax=Actinoplanes sp. CA-151224 TaxID=3239904 RepID=UPI003F491059